MLNYIHDIPTRLYFGKGQIAHLTEVLAPYGRSILLTYGGGSIKKTGLYDDIMTRLTSAGFTVHELSGIDPNPRIDSVRQGIRLCREYNVNAVLAVGGGSTIDCSKAIAAGYYYPDDPWNMILENKLQKALPLVDILTLAATGSEFDPTGVISNPVTKEKLGAKLTYPTVSICDPTYTFTVSRYQTAAGSADIMSHIFEGYFSRTMDCDLSDGIAESILKSVMKNAPIALAHPDDYTARANLMVDASIACSGIPEYGKQPTGWPCHAMEHELSAYYDITHGTGLAILTPRWMRYILHKDPGVTGRFTQFARNVLGLSDDDENRLAQEGIDTLERYFQSTGLPSTLSELGIGDEHFADMAEHANRNNRLSNSYVPLTKQDVIAIYSACL